MNATLAVAHVVHGELRTGAAGAHATRIGGSFAAPPLDLDELVLPRSVPGPAFELPLSEVIAFLGETGKHLDVETNPHLAEAAARMSAVSRHSRRVVEASFRG